MAVQDIIGQSIDISFQLKELGQGVPNLILEPLKIMKTPFLNLRYDKRYSKTYETNKELL